MDCRIFYLKKCIIYIIISIYIEMAFRRYNNIKKRISILFFYWFLIIVTRLSWEPINQRILALMQQSMYSPTHPTAGQPGGYHGIT